MNNDIPPIAADSTVDISDLPIKNDVKNAEEKNIVGEAYREADDTLKSNDNDIPHTGATKKYFLEKISQYKSLYDEGDTNSAVDRKLAALGEYFQDSSSTSSKWGNIDDVVVYGGLNTGVKFSSYLEYFVLPTAKRSKTPPAYYELLMKQISPFLDRVDVEHSSGTGKISFAQEAKANRLNEAESTEEASEEAMNFLDRVDAQFKHSGPNARSIANYVYLGAYDMKPRHEFSVVDETITVAMDKAIAHIRRRG